MDGEGVCGVGVGGVGEHRNGAQQQFQFSVLFVQTSRGVPMPKPTKSRTACSNCKIVKSRETVLAHNQFAAAMFVQLHSTKTLYIFFPALTSPVCSALCVRGCSPPQPTWGLAEAVQHGMPGHWGCCLLTAAPTICRPLLNCSQHLVNNIDELNMHTATKSTLPKQLNELVTHTQQ